jgi:hypothetical protein
MGRPATAAFDLQFSLFDNPTNGTQVAGTIAFENVAISNGLFTVGLDFGAEFFTGAQRWLEIQVRPAISDGGFALLSPRQELRPSPYAMNAMNLMSPVSQPLEIKVGGQRALRLEPTSNGANVIGGFSDNVISNGVTGSTIAGGGGTYYEEDGEGEPVLVMAPNVIADGYSFIGGGLGNRTDARLTVVGGGQQNVIQGEAVASFIGGGKWNWIATNAHESTISGGNRNLVASSGRHATIAGGIENAVGGPVGTIGGGEENSVAGRSAVVAGGAENRAVADYSAVAGGFENFVGSPYGTIGGGDNNRIAHESDWSVIAGGHGNSSSSARTTISGGNESIIDGGSSAATIGGGGSHRIGSNAGASTVGGGVANRIGDGSFRSTIGGGGESLIEGGANYTTIGGGAFNSIGSNSYNATLSGGAFNSINANAPNAIIPGGSQAHAMSFGQMVHANGGFTLSRGTAQTSEYILRRESTNAMETELFLDGHHERMTLPRDGSWTYHILVIAAATNGTSCSWELKGAIKNVGGATSLVGTGSVTPLGLQDDWSIEAQADDANDALVLHARGDGGPRVRWVAHVRTVEVVFQP